MSRQKKERVQAYLDPDLAVEIKERAVRGHRPESWEINYLLRLALNTEEPING
jgi:hypothetical protein